MGNPSGRNLVAEYAVSQLAFGPAQRPFRYGFGIHHCPPWLDALVAATTDETTREQLPPIWMMLVAHVANQDNDNGRFDPYSPDWLQATGLTPLDSEHLAQAFLSAGGLEQTLGRFLVRDWSEQYRSSRVFDQLVS